MKFPCDLSLSDVKRRLVTVLLGILDQCHVSGTNLRIQHFHFAFFSPRVVLSSRQVLSLHNVALHRTVLLRDVVDSGIQHVGGELEPPAWSEAWSKAAQVMSCLTRD